MAGFIKWERPRGVVHDLVHALSLGDNGCNLLVVDDSVLYVLQNLVGLDVEFKSRWSVQSTDHGFEPIDEDHPLYGQWIDLIDRVQSQVIDVSCDLVTALDNIKDAIDGLTAAVEAQTTQQDPWDDLLEDIAQTLLTAPTKSDLRFLAQSFGSTDFCCQEVSGSTYYEASPDPTPNPETSTFCDRAWSYARNYAESAAELMEKWSAGQVVTVSLLSLIAAALVPPIAFILAILGVIAVAIFEVSKDDYQEYVNGLIGDIACCIYTATDAADAQEAIKALLEASEKPELWPEPAATLVLKYLVSLDGLNQVFLETYPIRPDSESSDCEICEEPVEEDLFRTAQSSPYNVLEVGDDVYGWNYEHTEYGWRSVSSEITAVEFHVSETVTDWEVTFEWGHPPVWQEGDIQGHITVERYVGGNWQEYRDVAYTAIRSSPCAMAGDSVTIEDLTLSVGTQYRVFFAAALQYVWFRKMRGVKLA